MLKFRRYYINRLINIYESEVNTGGVPHLYSIGIFTILDYIHIFAIIKLFNGEVDKISVYLLITFFLGINYLIYKYVKVDYSYIPISKYLIYVYLGLPLIYLLIIFLFGGII